MAMPQLLKGFCGKGKPNIDRTCTESTTGWKSEIPVASAARVVHTQGQGGRGGGGPYRPLSAQYSALSF